MGEEKAKITKTAWQQEADRKIRINVSGYSFVTTRQTLGNHPNTKLGKLLQNEQMEHFFDADEDVFREVLRFQRTGELHVPKNLCRDTFIEQLKFWEVDEDNLSSCCRSDQLDNNELEKQFRWFERSIDPNVAMTWKHHVWYFLTDPMGKNTKYPKVAKIWLMFYVSLVVTELVNVAMFTVPEHLTSNNITANDSIQNDLSKSFSNQCAITARFLRVVADSPEYCLQYAIAGVFVVEIFVRLFSCPNKQAFWRSLSTLDFIIAQIELAFCTMILVLELKPSLLLTEYQCLAVNISCSVMIFIIQLKVFRLLAFTTHFSEVKVLLLAIYNSKREVNLLIVVLGLSSLLCGSLMFYAELFGSILEGLEDVPLNSIPISYWWVIVTMTTVGYGDYYPVTAIGYFVAAFIMMLGLMITALPIAIIGANFATFSDYNKVRQRNKEISREKKQANEELKVECLEG